MSKKLNIYLAGPRGFCAGVDRAIEMVKGALKKYGEPVYVRHEIVHNKFVVENLKSEGAIFIEELDEIKDKSRPVIFSAHGVPKSVPETALALNLIYFDATCPPVSKIHKEVTNILIKKFTSHFDWPSKSSRGNRNNGANQKSNIPCRESRGCKKTSIKYQ